MENKDVENRLAQIGNCAIEIISEEEVQGARLIIFKYDTYSNSAAIVYNTGELFHLRDWHGEYPGNKDEIADFDWVNEEGRDAIVFSGLPRML